VYLRLFLKNLFQFHSAISLFFPVTTGLQKENMLYLAYDQSLLLVFSITGKNYKISPLKNVHRRAAPHLHRQTVPRVDNRNEKCLSIKSRSVVRRCQTQQTMPPPGRVKKKILIEIRRISGLNCLKEHATSPEFIVFRKTTAQNISAIFRDVFITPQAIKKPYTIIESDLKFAQTSRNSHSKHHQIGIEE
jgi:hypothetical protein